MSSIIIPMAGLSSRFFKAGYALPKYMLDLNGQSMFAWSVSSFEDYFQIDHFIFIIRDVYHTADFILNEIQKLGIKDYTIIALTDETRGQADTVHLGLKKTFTESDLIIFNIDSRRHHYQKPDWIFECDGYLEVFNGSGDHWSFAEADTDNLVIRTAEKERISDLCSNGLYHFKNIALFNKAFEHAVNNNEFTHGEIYIAPLYNHLIQQGYKIKYDLVSNQEIDFCGTPDEYIKLNCDQPKL